MSPHKMIGWYMCLTPVLVWRSFLKAMRSMLAKSVWIWASLTSPRLGEKNMCVVATQIRSLWRFECLGCSKQIMPTLSLEFELNLAYRCRRQYGKSNSLVEAYHIFLKIFDEFMGNQVELIPLENQNSRQRWKKRKRIKATLKTIEQPSGLSPVRFLNKQ